MFIQTTRIDGKTDETLHKVIKLYGESSKGEETTVEDLVLSGASGFATDQTWEAFKASNTFGKDEYVSKLTEYGVVPDKAEEVADQIVKAVDSGWAKPFLVGVSAAGGTYAILEGLSATTNSSVSGWTRLKKLTVSAIIGVIVALAYVVLRHYGYLS